MTLRNLAWSVVAIVALVLFGPVRTASAHFIWLLPQQDDSGKTTVQVYFAEEAMPDNPELLGRLDGMKLWQLQADQEPVALKVHRHDDELGAPVQDENANRSLFVATHDLGVFDRGDDVFRLKYYAKTGPAVDNAAWTKIDCAKQLRLDVVPTVDGDTLRVHVRFDGRSVSGAEVKATGPGLDEFTGSTDEDGRAAFELKKAGVYSIRARHIEPKGGELDGKKYEETRHYSTVAIEASPAPPTVASVLLPKLPQSVTSFGGAILDGNLYVYGGHTGGAHSYSFKEQGHTLRRLDLDGGQWEALAEGPHLQGLAMVAHGGKLYRVGGFTAKNAEGEDHNLWSQDSAASFDPATKKWTNLPALPEPRSSHDAAVVGDTLYVVGGWQLQGEQESQWHTTAWSLDLSSKAPQWQSVPAPPFQRRALAAAAHDGKLYVIGGMQREGGTTTRTAVFDPSTGKWSEGPKLQGQGRLAGFGASAFATGGKLYVSLGDGTLQRLSADGSAWEVIAQTPTARFFHRLLPVDDNRLLVVGGANMGIGKFDEVEVLDVAATANAKKK